jgi:hypothetical protein
VWFGRNLLTFGEMNSLRPQRNIYLTSRPLINVAVTHSDHRWIGAALVLSSEIDIVNWRKKNNKEYETFL